VNPRAVRRPPVNERFVRRFRLCTAAALSLLAVSLASAPAQAVTVEAYQKWRLSGKTIRATPTGLISIHLGGVLQGLMLANSRLQAAGLPLLFCVSPKAPPAGMSNTALRKLIDKELKTTSRPLAAPWPPKSAVAAVILHALRNEWPCPSDRKTLR